MHKCLRYNSSQKYHPWLFMARQDEKRKTNITHKLYGRQFLLYKIHSSAFFKKKVYAPDWSQFNNLWASRPYNTHFRKTKNISNLLLLLLVLCNITIAIAISNFSLYVEMKALKIYLDEWFNWIALEPFVCSII